MAEIINGTNGTHGLTEELGAELGAKLGAETREFVRGKGKGKVKVKPAAPPVLDGLAFLRTHAAATAVTRIKTPGGLRATLAGIARDGNDESFGDLAAAQGTAVAITSTKGTTTGGLSHTVRATLPGEVLAEVFYALADRAAK